MKPYAGEDAKPDTIETNAVRRAQYWKDEHSAANDVIDRLRAVIARNCDPMDATPDDSVVIQECIDAAKVTK